MATTALVKSGDVATTGGDQLIQLVSFMLSNEEYGVEVLKVREIIRMPGITKMPNTPHYVESGNIDQEFITGVFNHADRLLIIMDVDQMFSPQEREYFGSAGE